MVASPDTVNKHAGAPIAGRAGKAALRAARKRAAATKAKAFADELAALQPAYEAIGFRLMTKAEVCAVTSATPPTLWAWMRAGTFPRSFVVHGRSMWRSDEIQAWLGALPTRRLKGDAPDDCKP